MEYVLQLRAGRTAVLFFFLFSFSVSASLFAGGRGAVPGDGAVVASTSWTAAIAYCAGAEDVRVLAPVDLRHPPEYELKPSDLAAAGRADLVVYAGWEVFAKKLAETAGSAGVRILQIAVSNDPDDIKVQAAKIAELLGTVEKYEAWAAGFDEFTAALRARLLGGRPVLRVAVHSTQVPFAAWLGFDIAGEYGPAEPSPALILDLVKTAPTLVIDNYHIPSGRPIAEAAGVPYVELINFPGKDGTRTVEDLFRYNADLLERAR
jgi:zinc transport system substrate-binding protein/iron/zinc/copper transport system substrate-binding protein